MRLLFAPVIILLPSQIAAAQTVVVPLPGVSPPAAAAPQPLSPNTPAIGNPYGRAIDLTVNIQFYKRDLGETMLHLAADGAATIDALGFTKAVNPILNDSGQAKLATAIGGRATISPQELKAVGIDAQFDRENVSILIAAIDPTMRKLQPIYRESGNSADREINAEPAGFSFFLNTAISQSRVWNGVGAGFRDPSIFLTSAVRVGKFVLEAAGQFADRNPSAPDKQFRFDRNYVRLVYDMPKLFVRTYAGDLTPEVRFQQNYAQIGGAGISRQKRRFDAFRSAVLQGNRQLILQRESTVEVYRNGILFQQLQLAPGAYDLSNLPLLSGSNDIELKVKDESGFSQNVSYQTYLDPIDLEPGDWEAAAYIGKMSTRFGLSPKYDGEVALTGFYRKAFIGHPALGVGVQASKSVQQLSAQTQFLIGPGRLDITAAGSKSKVGTGYFVGAAYDLALDQSDKATTVSLQGTFQSRYFTGLGAPFQVNSTIGNASAIFSRSFGPDLSAQVGATYVLNRKPIRNNYRIFAEAYYQLSRRWFVRGGVDYQRLAIFGGSKRQDGFGFNVAVVWRPSYEDRAEARYDYHLDNAQLSYEHSPDGYVGSIGYGAIASRNATQSSVQGYGNYVGNRFAASVSHSLVGSGFGQITNRQVTTARVSTAIAFAGGAFAVTRRIGDSFAILTPHPSLKGHDIIVGQLLTDARYRSKSGALGGAVNGSMASYITQSIQYDVEDPPAGYDIGQGVYRVRPAYHSGYHIVIGNDSFVTATGTLIDPEGKPVSLATGQLTDLDHPAEAASDFFTNSVGRFALSSLRPGGRYKVTVTGGRVFEFTVPQDNEGLLDLRNVSVPAGR